MTPIQKRAEEIVERIARSFKITSSKPPFYQPKQTEQDKEEQRFVRQVLRSGGVVNAIASALRAVQIETAEEMLNEARRTTGQDCPMQMSGQEFTYNALSAHVSRLNEGKV